MLLLRCSHTRAVISSVRKHRSRAILKSEHGNTNIENCRTLFLSEKILQVWKLPNLLSLLLFFVYSVAVNMNNFSTQHRLFINRHTSQPATHRYLKPINVNLVCVCVCAQIGIPPPPRTSSVDSIKCHDIDSTVVPVGCSTSVIPHCMDGSHDGR